MSKKIISVMALFCLMFTMILPVGAASEVVCETETVTTVYGDLEVEETLVVYSSARSSTKSASKTHTFRQSGEVIAEVTLYATFGYNGSSAWVTSASGSHTTYSGWSYGSESITKSGGTASLSASLTKFGVSAAVDISIKCTASGTIS